MSDNYKLIKKCQKGSNKAFDTLLRQYSDMVFGICLRFCKNNAEAEDLLQDCLIKIVEKINEFRFKGSFEGWVRRIAVTTNINYVRKKANCYNLDIDDVYYDPNIAINENVIDKLSADDIVKLLHKLPIGAQTVFNLYVVEGYKHKEIAEILGIQRSTSRSQYNRAKAMLIKMINEEKLR